MFSGYVGVEIAENRFEHWSDLLDLELDSISFYSPRKNYE